MEYYSKVYDDFGNPIGLVDVTSIINPQDNEE